MRRSLSWAIVLWAAISPLTFADVEWPAFLLKTHIPSWGSVCVGLFVEFLIIRWLFKPQNRRAAIATVLVYDPANSDKVLELEKQQAAIETLAANGTSTLIGVSLIPFAGVGVDMFPGASYARIIHWETFGPIAWLGSYAVASLLNTFIEAFVYRRGFKLRVRQREVFWIFVANALSGGLAFGSMFITPAGMHRP